MTEKVKKPSKTARIVVNPSCVERNAHPRTGFLVHWQSQTAETSIDTVPKKPVDTDSLGERGVYRIYCMCNNDTRIW